MIITTRSLTESLEKKYTLNESYWWEDWENLPKERTDEISKWAKNYVDEICKYELRNYYIIGPKFEDSNEKFTVIINNKIFDFDWADVWVNKAFCDENREENLPDDYEPIYDFIDDDPIGYRIINTIESSVDYSDGKLNESINEGGPTLDELPFDEIMNKESTEGNMNWYEEDHPTWKRYQKEVDEAYEYELDDELDAIMDDDTLSDEEKEAEIGRVLDKHDKLNEGNSCDGWIAFYNGKKLEIPKSDVDGGIYEAKQKAIKELKVPKSKLGLLAIKPAYNESLNEAQLNENPAIAAAARVVAPVALDLAANAISSGIDAKLNDRVDNLEEDFFDPTSWFYDLVNNYETWSGAEWNSWSQEERDAAVTKAMKHFLIDNQLSEEEAEEFKRDLTDNNFHTECKIFSELYGTV